MSKNTNNGHIKSKYYRNLYNTTAKETGLYQVELSEILLNDLVFKANYSLDNLIPEFKKIYTHVQDPVNKQKLEQYAEADKTVNIAIRVSSLSLVRYIASKANVTHESVIISLLGENIINCDDFDTHLWNILDYYYYMYTLKKWQYIEFLTKIPGYSEYRSNRR
jgi:hypothetical protein